MLSEAQRNPVLRVESRKGHLDGDLVSSRESFLGGGFFVAATSGRVPGLRSVAFFPGETSEIPHTRQTEAVGKVAFGGHTPPSYGALTTAPSYHPRVTSLNAGFSHGQYKVDHAQSWK